MPANLPPEYFEVEKKLRGVKSLEERIKVYEELLSVIPKHKGTEKLIGEIKSKIAKLKENLERKPATKYSAPHIIKRAGAGQIAIIGPPNSGKSRLLSVLTRAKPSVSEFPFTTKEPIAGMMPYENIQIQLIDTPSISETFYESYIHEIVKNADATVIFIDLQSSLVLEELDTVLRKFEERKVYFASSNFKDFSASFHLCRAIIAGNKFETSGAEENFLILKEFFGNRFEFIPVSVEKGINLELFKEKCFQILGIIRVYTKEPGKKPDLSSPFTLKKGAKVEDLASLIHKDFASKLSYARIWGKVKFDGQRVHRSYILEDGDIVELHI